MSIEPEKIFTQGTDGIETTVPLLANGNPIQNLGNATIILIMQNSDFRYEIPCSVIDIDNAIVQFELSSTETSNAGDYFVQFKVDWSDKTIYVPDPGYLIFRIQSSDPSTYCSIPDVYRKAGIDSTVLPEADVYEHILDAEAEVEEIYGKSFSGPIDVSEWFDTADSKVSSLPEEGVDVLFLGKTPVYSIESVECYDSKGNVEKTLTSDEYWIDEATGTLRLKFGIFQKQYYRVNVIYKYGYDRVPRKIRNLTSTIASMSLLMQQIGGTYDDVTSYSLPTGVSVGVGEPYMNMLRNIEKLDKELQRILMNIGRTKMNVVIV